MAREVRKSRFRYFGVYVRKCEVRISIHVRIYFIYWALKFLPFCNNFGICTHNTNPKMYNICVCVSASLSSLSSSFQAWPTSYCTVELILYECAAACSGHCRSTHLHSHTTQNRRATGSLTSFYHKDPTQRGCRLPRGDLNRFLHWLTAAK